MSDTNKKLEETHIVSINQLNESATDLSTTGKLFFASMAAYLSGKVGAGAFLKLRGTPEELRVIADALVASKAFQDELKRPGATIDSVIEKMNVKNMTAERFRQVTGKKFPL